MASTSTDSTSDSGSTTTSGSGDSGIMDFFMQPIGMALLGGVAIALVAGYLIL